jgi:hypothetical protein
MEGLKRQKELKKLMAEIRKEYDEKLKEIKEQFTSKVDPIQSSLDTADKVKHFNAIAEKHEDYETHVASGAILEWIGKKPKYMQAALKATYDNGKTEDVIELLDDFYKENGLLNNEENNNNPTLEKKDNVIDLQKAEKKKNLTAVVGKHGAVNIARPSPNDYDAAFDEALKS